MRIVTLAEEFQKNPELKESDVRMLKEWCEKQPHLPKVADLYLALFMHCNYYRVEPAKIAIENYYTCRTHMPEFFANRDPLGTKQIRKASKVVAIVPLGMPTKEGYWGMFSKFLDTDPSHYDFFESTKLFFMIADLCLLSRGTTNGFVYVADVTGVSMGHVARFNIAGVRKLLFYVQEGAPVRLKGIHLINTVPAVEVVMNMVRPFLKKELLNVLHFHSTLDTLAEFLPVEALPNEVGGKAGPLEETSNAWLKAVDDNREWYLQEEATGRTDERLRVATAGTAGGLFGVEGTFRKLDID